MPYFTTAEFRASMPDMSEISYPDTQVELARDWAEALIERVCGTSFITRTVTDVLSNCGEVSLVLSRPHVLSITSVTVDGVLLTGYTYTSKGGLLKRHATGSYTPTAWTAGQDNITVVYEAGYSAACPVDLKVAAMMAVRDRVIQWRERSGKPSDRATSMTNEFGNISYSVAGEDHPTGLPDADAVIMGWAAKVAVYGFA